MDSVDCAIVDALIRAHVHRAVTDARSSVKIV